jgi:hypothetical protein
MGASALKEVTMKHRGNAAFTLATAASLGLSLGVCSGTALAGQAGQAGTAVTNKVSPQKQALQLKMSDQHKVSAQSKAMSNQGKFSNQNKFSNQGKFSNQIKFKVEEKPEGR